MNRSPVQSLSDLKRDLSNTQRRLEQAKAAGLNRKVAEIEK